MRSSIFNAGHLQRRDTAWQGAKSVVTFINNLERDAAYKRWPKALKQLTYPTWSLHTIQVRPI